MGGIIAFDSYEMVLREHLPYVGIGPLDRSTELTALGLDSLGVIQMLVDLEQIFDVEFPDELLRPETFASVGSLWEILTQLAHDEIGSSDATPSVSA